MAGWQKVLTENNTATLTNKTFDANGTSNSISNIEVADLAAGVLDTDLSSAAGTDTTLASAKAIKAYADSLSHVDEDVNIANLTARLPQITDSFTIGDGTDVTVTTAGGLTVTGDLDVNGTTTSINTSNLEVSDAIIILRTGEAGVYAGGKADCGITFLGTSTTPVITEIGKLVWDYTGGMTYAAGNDNIGLFKIGTTDAISNFADQNDVDIATQMPALYSGGNRLDAVSGAAYKAVGTAGANHDGLVIWNGTDLYIYDS